MGILNFLDRKSVGTDATDDSSSEPLAITSTILSSCPASHLDTLWRTPKEAPHPVLLPMPLPPHHSGGSTAILHSQGSKKLETIISLCSQIRESTHAKKYRRAAPSWLQAADQAQNQIATSQVPQGLPVAGLALNWLVSGLCDQQYGRGGPTQDGPSSILVVTVSNTAMGHL